jgi:drug/metabolite transporter (DMT)-like permease
VNRAAVLKLGIVVLIFGAAFPVLKWGLTGGATPVWFAAWRAIMSAGVALAVVLAMQGLAWPSRADLAPILGIGLFQIAGFFLLLYAALTLVPAGTASVLSYTTALWLVPISALWLRERLTGKRLLAVALGLAGILAIANPATLDTTQPGQLLGVGLLLAAALSWAIAIAMLRAARAKLSTVQMLPFAFAVASLVLLPLALLLEPEGGLSRESAPVIALLAVGLLGPVATWAASEVSRDLPAVVSSLGFLGTPVLGLLLSVAVLGEPLTLGLALGAALVVAGVAVAARG